MILESGAAGGLGSPLPDGVALPVQLADGAIAEDAAGIAGDAAELEEDVAALATDEARVDDVAGQALVGPAMHLVAVHIDEVGCAVGSAEGDEAVVGTSGIVEGDAGGVDARRAGGCGHEEGEERGGGGDGPSQTSGLGRGDQHG